ncbi:MAG: prolyl-tRNA synthetase associated domain-containing protein [Eubacterium sp.]|nr:prolyl-tRNA synthetase associated domain-containing protein [Candidatus Colimonas fimequi]
MLNKQDVYEYLKATGIDHYIVEHPAVFTVDEVDQIELPERETETKNLFLRDDKKRNYYLLVMESHKRANLAKVREILGSRPLKFASEKDLLEIMGLLKGSVTALGILNDEERKVQVFIDRYFQGKRIACHPNENTATVYMNTDDLVKIIKDHGNPLDYIDLE